MQETVACARYSKLLVACPHTYISREKDKNVRVYECTRCFWAGLDDNKDKIIDMEDLSC